jgi:hypothetical protein
VVFGAASGHGTGEQTISSDGPGVSRYAIVCRNRSGRSWTKVNQALRGWAAYFRVGNSARKFMDVDHYVGER